MSIVHAHIIDKQVVNLILCDTDWKVDEGIIIPVEEGISIGWTYDGMKFTEPKSTPLSEEELIAQIEAEKVNRVAEAKEVISLWQTKLLLGRTLPDDETKLMGLWVDYIDAVTAIKSDSKKAISWPKKPEISK